MLSARAGLRRDPLRSTRGLVQAGRAGQDSPLPQEGDDGDAAMNAIERVIVRWRNRALALERGISAICADELERLKDEVIEPLVAALKDAIDYPGDVLVRGRAEAALAKLEGREDATNGREA